MKQKGKKNKPLSPYESVKLNRDIVDRVRAYKERTGVTVSAFFEKAAEEKLFRDLTGLDK